MFYKNVFNGFIESISTGYGQVEITKQEYEHINSLIETAPKDAPTGFHYHLLDDTLTWELVEDPPIPDPPDQEAAESDYQNALEQMGVNFDEGQ